MKTATNHPKSLCKRDGKGASSACHWRNWKASESAIRPPRPSPTGITGAPTDIVSNSLADFAVNGCKDPPCCQLSLERVAASVGLLNGAPIEFELVKDSRRSSSR